MQHRNLLITDDATILDIAASAHRVAVLGIKPETHADQPAFYVPKYLADQGVEVIPVPVYYPNVREILGRPVYRDLRDVPPPVDVLCVFRRPEDLVEHVEEIIAFRPGVVWFQSGITNEEVALRIAKAGIPVVQDRCLMVEHRRASI